MAKPKQKIIGVLHVNVYEVLSRAIEAGVAYGLQRAHKYTDKPDKDVVEGQVCTAIMNEICAVFYFDAEEFEGR